MGLMRFDAPQIAFIRRVKQGQVLVEDGGVFLLEDFAVLGVYLVSVLVVLPVFCHLVDKEQGKAFDAAPVKLLLLLKVGADGFPDLHPAHILFGHVADDLAHADDLPVGEGDGLADGVDLIHAVAPVLLHVFGEGKQVVVHAHQPGLAAHGLVVADLEFQTRHRRLVRGDDDALQIQIAVRAAQVLDIKALDLDLLDQPLVVGVQRVQHIHKRMVLLVGGGVVEGEQGIEFLQALLRGGAAHLLRLVQNDDGTVGLDDVDGAAAAEVVKLRADAAGVLPAGIERLNIDDHDVDVGALAEIVDLGEVL